MSVSVSITHDQIMHTLCNFVLAVTGVPTVQGMSNRVASPRGDYVVITAIYAQALSTPHTHYAPNVDEMTLTRPTEWRAQIDCYGALAQDCALTIAMLLRSPIGCAALAGVQPLDVGQARQLPFHTGENQYMPRWTFDAIFQINPSLTVSQQFADTLHIGLKEIDTHS